jgi:catechol 2,3-dioxygenase-like lactoylglutathione lyase family enzyme
MRLNHIHVAVRNLGAAVEWLERVWRLKADFQNEHLAIFSSGDFILILDAADADSPATIGFESDDCDRDFREVTEHGAVAIETPNDKPWGARSAYLHGPGHLIFEIEQPLK